MNLGEELARSPKLVERKEPVAASDKALARKLRDEGLTYPEIGKRLGFCHKTISRWLKQT